VKTYAYGYPRLGKNREFKKVIESFWDGKIDKENMLSEIRELDNKRLEKYKESVDIFPVGEMTFYDNMLDMYFILGVEEYSISRYFELARGKNAFPMKKWFNTNYHYIVPEVNKKTVFSFKWDKFKEYDVNGNPVYLIGAFTFLKLSRGYDKEDFKDILNNMKNAYREIFGKYKNIHLDEPAFVMDLEKDEIEMIVEFYKDVISDNNNINVFTYYSYVEFLNELYNLPFNGIGLDFVNGKENFGILKEKGFPENKVLIAGLVDGRNVWKTDIKKQKEFLMELKKYGKDTYISNASPLFHLPISVEIESSLDEKLKKMISFADERLKEINLFNEDNIVSSLEEINFGYDEEVREKINALKEEDFIRSVDFNRRKEIQKDIFKFPLFPTTTIGSFPQTKEVRKMRSDFRKGVISEKEYKEFIRKEIKKLIDLQEEIGLDVLVHGEFERTDMVEFFAEKLSGIATTKNGWIISYGTRGYRPPIIYGDVKRVMPMTLDEIKYAQSLTEKKVKGMLTGAVTIIAWSYTRKDIPTRDVSYQIALALKEEIQDYVKNGITIVQIDEPAFREKAPIKKREWKDYFDWAVKSFNLTSSFPPEVQVHTHMCYSEFGEIIDYIMKMEFDVISIEATRSKASIVEDFKKVKFEKQIGLGVWDIHSPYVPTVDNMKEVVLRALEILNKENFWINPDCGLKTRKWKEVVPSLKNLVELSKILRGEYS